MEPKLGSEGEARKRALIVDNSKGLRVLLGWMLQEAGIESVEANDGPEALRILEADEQFAAVIVDWDLPGMNGIQLVAEIRRHKKLRSLPIIMVSGRPHSSDVGYAIKSGVDDYVIKPFTRDAILRSLIRVGLIRP
jgi:two-component system chemotaxis response regulator CheY